MHDLPWLVIHGATLWKALFALSLPAGPAWLAHGRPWLDRRRARARAQTFANYTTDTTGLTPGTRVILEGQLHVDGEPCERLEDGAPVAAAWAISGFADPIVVRASASSLQLHVGHERIQLHGPMNMEVGTCLFMPARPLDEAACKRINAASPRSAIRDPAEDTHRLWSIDDGATVRIRGAIQRFACDATSPHDYRTSAVRWTIRGDDEAWLDIAATGNPKVVHPWKHHLLHSVLLSGTAFLLLANFVGMLCMSRARPDRYSSLRNDDGTIDNFDPIVIAAATPFHRSDALEQIHKRLTAYAPPSSIPPTGRARVDRVEARNPQPMSPGRLKAVYALLAKVLSTEYVRATYTITIYITAIESQLMSQRRGSHGFTLHPRPSDFDDALRESDIFDQIGEIVQEQQNEDRKRDRTPWNRATFAFTRGQPLSVKLDWPASE